MSAVIAGLPDVGIEKQRRENRPTQWVVTTGIHYLTPSQARDYAEELLDAAFQAERFAARDGL